MIIILIIISLNKFQSKGKAQCGLYVAAMLLLLVSL